jgi:hypothetical protein
MNDRYGVVGKTMSRQISLLNQDQNPLIRTGTPTTNPTLQATVTPTTQLTTVPKTTQKTSIPTTPEPSELSTTLTTVPSQIPSPSPTQTKSSGFEAILASAAIVIGLVLYFRKE